MPEKWSKEIESSRAEAEVAAFAARIVTAFLIPACEATDYAERWKAVNRAAGVIAGVSAFPEDCENIAIAQDLTATCLEAMKARFPLPSPHAIARDMIAGPNGLPKRVAECLLALGVGR